MSHTGTMSVIASPTLRLLTVAAVVAVPVLAAAPTSAAPGGPAEKVRICHRTNAVTNPYVSIEVARSAVDGTGGKGDHYVNHTGPIWTPQTGKKDDWGDIIPPIEGVHDGRNWTILGQAMWSAGCRPVVIADTDNDGTPDITDPDTDGDRVPDTSDTDDDGDGTTDTQDPDESTTTDTDGDTVPDPVDADDDGDGITDDGDCEAKPEETPTAETPPATDSAAADAVAPLLRSGDCAPNGAVVPPVDDATDTDGDGTTDGSDRDDDNDGVTDVNDPDQDGDGNPDTTDSDDDNDNIPDALDPDTTVLDPEDEITNDTDGDGTPDITDRDDDGDGVPDTRDGDADGNGQPETKLLALTSDPLPARIEAGEPTVLWDEELLTVLGTPASASVRCRSAFRGDVVGTSRSLCEVRSSLTKGTVVVTGEVPTIVSVRFSAPARGEFRALDEVRTYRVTP